MSGNITKEDKSLRDRTIGELESEGYAIILWTPDELRGINPTKVEDYSIWAGNLYIQQNGLPDKTNSNSS
jgi:hypothetical protein